MNKNQAAAYVQSQAACALIEAMSMWAANHTAQEAGSPVPHKKEDFYALIDKWGIHHNAVHDYLFVNNQE